MFLEAMAIAGAATTIYGLVKSGKDKAKAMRQQAEISRMQADELLARQEINERIMQEQTAFAKDQLVTRQSFGTSRGLGGLIRLQNDLEQNIRLSRREAEWKAKMLRMGADVETGLASDIQTGAYINATGTLLTSGGDIYRDYFKKPSKSLPNNTLWDSIENVSTYSNKA